jgi:hypothetical protein
MQEKLKFEIKICKFSAKIEIKTQKKRMKSKAPDEGAIFIPERSEL